MNNSPPTRTNIESPAEKPSRIDPAQGKPARPGQVPSNEEPELGFERDLPTEDDSKD